MTSPNTNVFVSSHLSYFTDGDFSKNFTKSPEMKYTGSYVH